MKFLDPRMVLLGLFAFAAVGTASATQMKTSTPGSAASAASEITVAKAAENPWPTLASAGDKQTGPLLAREDGYWRDGHWHDNRRDWRRDDWRREQWRRDQWRREQARREDERRRYWDRHNDRAQHHRYDEERRYYRR